MAEKKEKDPTRVAAGKKSKGKGKVFEQLIVKKLKAAGFDEVKRGWWQSGEFARFAGQKSAGAKPRVPDVMLDGFWLELGTGAAMDTHKKLNQALDDCPPADDEWDKAILPVSMVRRKGSRLIYCTMLLLDFEKLLARIRGTVPYATSSCGNSLELVTRVTLRFEEFVDLVAALRLAERQREEACPMDAFHMIGEDEGQ